MNNKGYSYLEVLIAGTLLSIIIIPITLTLYQGMQNLHFSNERYNAVLLADSLLVEVANSIIIMDEPIEKLDEIYKNNGLILEVLNIIHEDFSIRYKSDLFNYVLTIYEYDFLTSEVNTKYLFSCGNTEITNNSYIYTQSTNINHIDEIIMFETNSLENIQAINYITANDNNITIDIPNYITEDITILIYLSDIERDYLNIDIVNLSSSNLNVLIYKDKNLPNEDIIITQSSEREKGGILTTVSNNNEIIELLITIEVYNKDNAKLYKAFRPIVLYY